MLRLMVIAGPDLGLAGEFDGETLTVGRGVGNGFVLTDPRVSAKHGQITRVGESFRYEDLGSRNGSQWVARGRPPARVESVVPLGDGDALALGPGTLIVTRMGFAASAEVTPSAVPGLEERLERDPVGLHTLFRFDRQLASATSLPELWAAFRDGLAVAFPTATQIALLAPDDEGGWRLAAALDRRRGGAGEAGMVGGVPYSRLMVRDASRAGVARLYRDSFPEISVGAEKSSWPVFATMCVPLIVEDEVAGVAQVDHRAPGAAFDTEDLELLAVLCRRASQALAAERARGRHHQTWRQQLARALDHDAGEWSVLISSLTDDLAGSARRLLAALDAAESGARARVATEREYFWDCLETLRVNVTMARQVAFPLSHSLLERPWVTDREAVDVPALLRQLARTERPRAAGEIEVSERVLPPVMADRGRLFRALLNLLQNALQAQEEGGSEVEVRLDAQVEPIVDARFPGGRCLAIRMVDTGPGFDPDVLERIKNGEAVTTRPHGAGMGIQVARAILEAHGGTLAIESRPGEGTTATARLPLA